MDAERIKEAEELINDLYILLDLKDEEINDLRNENKMLRGQLSRIIVDRRVEIA